MQYSAACHGKANPNDLTLRFIQTFAVEAVKYPDDLLWRETWWMAHVDTLYQGLNTRLESHTLLRGRISF